jgi:hypothetical protein
MSNIGPKGKMKTERGVPTAKLMQQFDSLPSALRKAIAESPVDWGLIAIVKAFEKRALLYSREAAEAEMIALVKQQEQRLFDAANIGAVWGPGHPQARGATAAALGL